MSQIEVVGPGKQTEGRPGAQPMDETFPMLPRRQVMLTLGGVMLAMFLAALDQTIVGTAMPRIIADLGGFDRFTWITTAYLVSSTTAVPIVGRLTDLYGRKWFYVGGILIFMIGSVTAGLAHTMNELIAFRAVQGLGGGIMMANAFVVIGDLFPPAERGKYQGLLAAVFGLSSVVGPTLGGFLTDNLSWHWIFYVNVPMAIPVIALFIRYFPDTHPTSERRQIQIDYLGVALLTLAVVTFILGLSWADVQYAWGSPQVLGALGTGIAAAAVFVFVESRAADPIMPLVIFRNSVVAISLLVMFLTGFGMFGAIIFIPLYFQAVLGASATSSGSFLTPMMLGIVFGAALSGQVLSRLGGHYRIQGLVGLAIMGTGAGLLTQASADSSFGAAVAKIVVLGFGLGSTFPLYTIAIQNAVPYRFLGIATASTQFFRSIGGTLGLALLGAFMVRQFRAAMEGNMPPDAAAALGDPRISRIIDQPQALVDPQAVARFHDAFASQGPAGAAMAERIIAVMRDAMAGAIGDVFVITLLTVALGFVATVFLREVPLRRAHSA